MVMFAVRSKFSCCSNCCTICCTDDLRRGASDWAGEPWAGAGSFRVFAWACKSVAVVASDWAMRSVSFGTEGEDMMGLRASAGRESACGLDVFKFRIPRVVRVGVGGRRDEVFGKSRFAGQEATKTRGLALLFLSLEMSPWTLALDLKRVHKGRANNYLL